MEVTLRAATQNDVKYIAELIRESSLEFIVHEFDSAAKDAFLRNNNAYMIGKFIETGFTYHVAEVDGKIVGVVGVRGVNHLYHLFVAKPYQCQGIGRQLWEHAKKVCLEKGNAGIFTVNSSNCALPVYQKLGFTQTGPTENSGGIISTPMKLVES
jgi:N-acetylglutamate synthase-like GNAT family acetyltransferase